MVKRWHYWCRYVERFRHSAPLSREQRQKMAVADAAEFWWLQDRDESSEPSDKQPAASEQKNVPVVSCYFLLVNLQNKTYFSSAALTELGKVFFQ